MLSIAIHWSIDVVAYRLSKGYMLLLNISENAGWITGYTERFCKWYLGLSQTDKSCMQSKSDMSDSQHMQYCLAQRSCTVSTNLAAHPFHMHALSVLRGKSEFSQHTTSCTSTETPMATEIQGKPCHVCSSYKKLHWPCNNDTPCMKQDVLYHMGSSAPSDIYFCDHTTLCLPSRVQRSTSVYAHEFGGQKTLCDYLIFN